MTLSEFEIVLGALTNDWVSQDHGLAVQIIQREIKKMTRRQRRKPLADIPPHQSHSDTSRAAALQSSLTFSDTRYGVLFALSKWPMTDEEAQTGLSIPGNSYRPCRVTLMDAGLVEDSGHRRRTKANRLAVVWKVTHEGLKTLGSLHKGA